jgi:hypothetical protein
MEAQRIANSQSNSDQKNNTGSITIPNFKVYYRAIVTNVAWYWRKNRHEDQCNRIEDPDTNKLQLSDFDKGSQNMHWRKDSLLNKWSWENWIFISRRLTLDPRFLPCTSINSKWIKDHNIRSEMVRSIQGKIGNTLDHVVIGNNFE